MRAASSIRLSCILVAVIAATGCVSTEDIQGIQTQISDVQRQLLQMQQLAPSKTDVGNLEVSMGKQMDSLLKTEADMQVKLQDLTGQIEALQAKLEDTTYRLSQLSQQIAATNQELKSFRVAPAPAPLAPGTPGAPNDPNFGVPAPVPAPPSGTGADPKALYDAAYNDYLKGSYDLSIREFQEYLQNFPDTDLADNATYWIGEGWYRQKKYRQAVEQYDQMLSRYPKSDKAASATLKKGYSFLELGEKTKGLLQLQRVVRDFPASDEANLARQRLRELGG
ncbi:MAG TPA: tol-pal system protein YbgF [Thermoanaerobaculia bacterium]|jgi:tol-pal system protein YbgF|nr:tol-pal system protein YbgF [Thermoanaerobaculia bacterium]